MRVTLLYKELRVIVKYLIIKRLFFSYILDSLQLGIPSI